MSIYLTLAEQETIWQYMNVMAVLSTTLNVTGLVFLLRQTPSNQSTIRNYLILIQILLLVGDLHLDIGFHAIPLFPVLAGYAVGVLIQIGFTVHLELAITIVFYIWIGISILFCILYRHQTILPEKHALKFKQRTAFIIQFVLFLLFTSPAVIYAFNGNDVATVEEYLVQDPHNVTWIRDRGPFYVEKRTPFMQTLFIVILFILSFATTAVLLAFAHMFYVLRQDSAQRSSQSVHAIRRSLIALFIQLEVPITLFFLPASVIFLGLAIDDLLTFDTSITAFLILPWHSVGHNFILLAITPAYRKRILAFFKFISCRSPLSTAHSDTRIRNSTSFR